MNEIAQRIIDDTILFVEQADKVCSDLDQLTDTDSLQDFEEAADRFVRTAKWASDLARHHDIEAFHPLLQIAGWKAAAKAYRNQITEDSWGKA